MVEEKREVRFQGIYAVKILEEPNQVIGYAEGNPYDIEKVFSKRVGKKINAEEINVERVTSLQEKLVDLEGKVLSRAEFTKIFPGWGRVVTDQGYDCGRPLYIVGGDGFSFDWGESVAGYDCGNCGGIVLGQPKVNRECFYPSRGSYNCIRCDTPVYKWDGDY